MIIMRRLSDPKKKNANPRACLVHPEHASYKQTCSLCYKFQLVSKCLSRAFCKICLCSFKQPMYLVWRRQGLNIYLGQGCSVTLHTTPHSVPRTLHHHCPLGPLSSTFPPSVLCSDCPGFVFLAWFLYVTTTDETDDLLKMHLFFLKDGMLLWTGKTSCLEEKSKGWGWHACSTTGRTLPLMFYHRCNTEPHVLPQDIQNLPFQYLLDFF